MTRVELSAILSDLVRRHSITLEEARATLARFDNGDLTDLPVSAPQEDTNRWVLGLALLLFMMKGNTRRPLNASERKRAQKLLRGRYEANVAQLASSVAVGGPIVKLTVAAWYLGMQTAISDYARTMAVAGAGTLPKASVQASIDERISEQWPFLQGFATQILARQQGDRSMSEAWISQRGRMYGATGWSAFFRGQGSVATRGYVDVWVSRDDPFVCSICSPRHQKYFLPDVGPYPGDPFECKGTCRCERIPEYLPDIYADLSGSRSSQVHPVNRDKIARTRVR